MTVVGVGVFVFVGVGVLVGVLVACPVVVVVPPVVVGVIPPVVPDVAVGVTPPLVPTVIVVFPFDAHSMISVALTSFFTTLLSVVEPSVHLNVNVPVPVFFVLNTTLP